MSQEKILIVDDEATIIQLYQIELEDQFDITIAESAEDGLKILRENGTFAVVVSDMQMPGMNGAEFLSKVQNESPQTVRVMLTGNDKQEVAVDAVNEGQIFRFLNKPCPTDRLKMAIEASLKQYRLLRAEKDLLDKTLRGTITLLTDMLSVVKPLAFGRASRVKRIVEQLCAETEVESAWEVSLAAMLSQIGCVSLSDESLKKIHAGEALSIPEQQEYRKHAGFGSELISKIPRLERIGALIAAQETPYAKLENRVEDKQIKRAAFLNVALTFDRLTNAGESPRQAISAMLAEPDVYATHVVAILDALHESKIEVSKCEVSLSEVRVGMIFEKDVVQQNGTILVTQGQEVSEMLLGQLHKRAGNIIEPLTVLKTVDI